MWSPPRELHIRLVVSDGDAIGGLQLAAAELKQRALQARDRRVEFACVQAHDRILAVAAAYERLQVLALERPQEMAENLPALCQDLFGCLEYPPAPMARSDNADACFPVLTALAADGVVADIMEESAVRSASDQGCTVSLSLDRDSAGEWIVSATNGDALIVQGGPLGAGDRLAAWKRAVMDWARERVLHRADARYPAPSTEAL